LKFGSVDGKYRLCCHIFTPDEVGNYTQPISTIFNNEEYKKTRLQMLNGEIPYPCDEACYKKERLGGESNRQQVNKRFKQFEKFQNFTRKDGSVPNNPIYIDIRFGNKCNFKCRICGPHSSSTWFKDAKNVSVYKNVKAQLEDYYTDSPDFWNYLDKIKKSVRYFYFAGGEPLMMDEHYVILEELERRKKFNVKLIYNTNFTQIKLKDRMVFDYWRKFDSVAVGASLDAMGPRAEYIRKGTKWAEIEENRRKMQEICPRVDFYISPTLSIMNALHIPDFHKNWVERGFIKAQDLDVNILQDPVFYRIDIAPTSYKEKIKQKFNEHLEWLRPQDKLRRATVGFESALNYLEGDNTDQLTNFWQQTYKLDKIRNENIIEAIPELVEIKNESTK